MRSVEYKVIPKLRKSRVLTPAQLGCLTGIPTLNITSGCIFQCTYCYARGYRQAPPPGEVYLYVNLPALLKEAVMKKKILPEWAIVNTSSDCFQSHPDILDVTYDVFRILLDHGIGISFLTKGRIPFRFFDLLGRFPHKIVAQIGLVSLSERYWSEYEPGTPSPEERLENVQKLKEIGILPEIRIDPMIPFLTDTESEATALFGRLKETGVKKVSISYLHLRPAIEKQLKKELSPVHRRMIESCFGFQQWKAVGASTMTKLLPRTVREKGYRRISGIAESFGIATSICQCKNPDMKADLCGSGRVKAALRKKGRLQLPLFRC